MGYIKHTLSCGVALGCAITSDRSDLRSTYLLIATSLFHSTVLSLALPRSPSLSRYRSLVCSLSLSVAHSDAGDSAATGELSPLIDVCYRKREGSVGSPARPHHLAQHPPTPPPAPALSTSNVQRKRTLQLNESNPSGIDAIIEAAGTVFCYFSHPPLLSDAPSVLSRVGEGSVFPSLWFFSQAPDTCHY